MGFKELANASKLPVTTAWATWRLAPATQSATCGWGVVALSAKVTPTTGDFIDGRFGVTGLKFIEPHIQQDSSVDSNAARPPRLLTSGAALRLALTARQSGLHEGHQTDRLVRWPAAAARAAVAFPRWPEHANLPLEIRTNTRTSLSFHDRYRDSVGGRRPRCGTAMRTLA